MKQPSFVRNMATLVTGGVVSNLITLATIPIISRLFNPEDFGASALFASIVVMLSIVVTLRYEHAIVLPASNSEAAGLIALTTLITVASTILLLVAVTLVYVFAPGVPWVQILGGWFVFVPLAVFLVAVANIVMGFNTRENEFGQIATAEVARVSTDSGLRIVAGVLQGSSVGALVTTFLIGNAVRVYVLSKNHWSKLSGLISAFDKNSIVTLLRRYEQFPRYSMPTGLLRSFGQNIPVFALAVMFNPAVVGIYAMAYRLLRLPIAVIGEAVRRTYLQKAAEIINRGDSLFKSLLQTTVALLALGLLLFTPLFIWGPGLLVWILGDKWSGTGEYVAILTPWFLMMFVQTSSSVVYIVYERQDLLFKVHVVSTVVLVVVFLLANYFRMSAPHTLMAASTVGTIANLNILFLGCYLARQVVLRRK